MSGFWRNLVTTNSFRMIRLVTLLLFINLGFSQNQGFEIKYDISFSNGLSNNKLKSIYFTLLITQNESYFYSNTVMGIDDSKYQRFISILSNQFYYVNLEEKLKLGGIKISGKKLLVEEEWKKGWILKNEFKKILGLKCQKAIRLLKPRKSDETKTVTAWFSNDISYPFGPKDNEGLPGLILEYGDDIKFTAYSIEKKELKIQRPLGEILSGEELKRKTHQLMRN